MDKPCKHFEFVAMNPNDYRLVDQVVGEFAQTNDKFCRYCGVPLPEFQRYAMTTFSKETFEVANG
jgi:hypothetical protein